MPFRRRHDPHDDDHGYDENESVYPSAVDPSHHQDDGSGYEQEHSGTGYAGGSHAYVGDRDQHHAQVADHDDDHFDPIGFDDEDYYVEERRRGPLRRTLGCLIPIALVAGIAGGGYAAYRHLLDNFGSPSCRFTAQDMKYNFDPEQSANASTITDVGIFRKGMPSRAATVAITTAIQESKLRNLEYGDLDSIGLFQQRPSQGWGTAAQIKDPVFAATSFYNALAKVDGWQKLTIGVAAQTVQRSGYPDAYNDHESQGEVLSAALTGATAEGVGCRLDPATSASTPAQVVQSLNTQSGLTARTSGNNSVVYTGSDVATARAVAAWAITHAETDGITTVTLGERAWERHRGQDGWTWHDAKKATDSNTIVRIDLADAKS